MGTPFQIEKGIPIPATTVRQGSNITALRSMEPGDSHLFEKADVKKATRFYRVAKKLGIKIIIRKEGEGLRMWRVAEEGVGAATAAKLSDGLAEAAIRERMQKINKLTKKKPAKKKQRTNAQIAKAARDKRYRARKKAAQPNLGKNL